MKKSIVCILIAILAIAMFVSCDPGIKTTREVKRLVFFDEGTRGTLKYKDETSAVFGEGNWKVEDFDWYYLATETTATNHENIGEPVTTLKKIILTSTDVSGGSTGSTVDPAKENASSHQFYVDDEFVFEIFGYEKCKNDIMFTDSRVLLTDTDVNTADDANKYASYPIFHALASTNTDAGVEGLVKMATQTTLIFNVELTNFGKHRYYEPANGKAASIGFRNFKYSLATDTDLWSAIQSSGVANTLIAISTSSTDNIGGYEFDNVGYIAQSLANGTIEINTETIFTTVSDVNAPGARFTPSEDAQNLRLRILVPYMSAGNSELERVIKVYDLTTGTDVQYGSFLTGSTSYIVLAECNPLDAKVYLHNNFTTWLSVELEGYGTPDSHETVTSIEIDVEMDRDAIDEDLLPDPAYYYTLSEDMFSTATDGSANPISFTTGSDVTTATIYLGEGFTTESDFGYTTKNDLVFGLCVYNEEGEIVVCSATTEKYVGIEKNAVLDLVIDSTVVDAGLEENYSLYDTFLDLLNGDEEVSMSIDIGFFDGEYFYTYATYKFEYAKPTK